MSPGLTLGNHASLPALFLCSGKRSSGRLRVRQSPSPRVEHTCTRTPQLREVTGWSSRWLSSRWSSPTTLWTSMAMYDTILHPVQLELFSLLVCFGSLCSFSLYPSDHPALHASLLPKVSCHPGRQSLHGPLGPVSDLLLPRDVLHRSDRLPEPKGTVMYSSFTKHLKVQCARVGHLPNVYKQGRHITRVTSNCC